MNVDYGRIWAEIDLKNLRFNLNSIHEGLLPETKICAVIKANAYGHGASHIAREIEDLPYIWGYVVATREEAYALRDNGISKPVLLLGPVSEEDYARLIEERIRPVFYELPKVRAFSNIASRLNRVGLFHIAVDTGMNRIGLFPDEEGIHTVKEMVACPNVRAEGIFTHLATADMLDNAPALKQNGAFLDFLIRLQCEGITFEYTHGANSAATILFQGLNYTMCRVGVAMYGLCPSEDYDWMKTPLKPVLSLYSRVMYVKSVPAGVAVGYGGSFTTHRPTVIATIPAGYADGYARSLSNKGEVLIRGHRCPIIGKICMDQMMVDVTNLPFDVQENDLVTLIGTDGRETISLEELGKKSGRFNYEFVCCLSDRVKRVYRRD